LSADPSTLSPSVRKPLQVGIPLFPDVEVLDFAGPFEVFSIAARIAADAPDLEQPPFDVVTDVPARLR
jgi:transcriptional regulator GlxA family with amidase domain